MVLVAVGIRVHCSWLIFRALAACRFLAMIGRFLILSISDKRLVALVAGTLSGCSVFIFVSSS